MPVVRACFERTGIAADGETLALSVSSVTNNLRKSFGTLFVAFQSVEFEGVMKERILGRSENGWMDGF